MPTTRPPRRLAAKARLLPRYSGAGLTHTGHVRDANEDAILTDPETGTLWAIADGMGGYGQGDVASDIITRQLALIEATLDPIAALSQSLIQANTAILQQAGVQQMGATVVAMMLQNAVAHVVWAGDCRAYLFRQGHMKLVTRDHTVVQELVDQGVLGGTAREQHPDAHVVTRAVGYEPEVEIDAVQVPVVPQDLIVLCSDGLTACLGDHDIADHLALGGPPDMLCANLITAALERGAPDNVSVICVAVLPGETP